MKTKIILFTSIFILMIGSVFLWREDSLKHIFSPNLQKPPTYTSNINTTQPERLSPSLTPVLTISPSLSLGWKTFNYNFPDYNPNFSIDYPANWETLIDYESSGGNDVRLSKGTRKIEFDTTVIGEHPHEEVLRSFLTNFNSYGFNFKVELIKEESLKSGGFPQSVPYSIYKLSNTSEPSINYAIIAQPYHMEYGKGFLLIWDRSGEDLELITEMLESLKVIP